MAFSYLGFAQWKSALAGSPALLIHNRLQIASLELFTP